MENASKALIMAAGILIGVLVFTIFAYEMVSIADTGETYQSAITSTQIGEFNSQFEKYFNRSLVAQDVATLYNYVNQWNGANESDKITIKYASGMSTMENELKIKGVEYFLNNYSMDSSGNINYFYISNPKYRDVIVGKSENGDRNDL